MSEKELIRNQRWRLGIIRHYEEVSKNKAKTGRISASAERYFTVGTRDTENTGLKGSDISPVGR